MVFDNMLQLATATATIEVKGTEETVKLLTIREKQEYESMMNKGLGKVKANIGNERNTNTADLDIEKVTKAQNEADNYLIKTTFSKDGQNITDDDIDKLYDVYEPLVKELKRVNHINEVDDDTLENELKKL